MSLERVARRARVSTATVSRVLNSTGPVKSSTRARVLKAIEAFKYSPNLHARSLAGGQSRSIGMIVSNIDNPFLPGVEFAEINHVSAYIIARHTRLRAMRPSGLSAAIALAAALAALPATALQDTALKDHDEACRGTRLLTRPLQHQRFRQTALTRT